MQTYLCNITTEPSLVANNVRITVRVAQRTVTKVCVVCYTITTTKSNVTVIDTYTRSLCT